MLTHEDVVRAHGRLRGVVQRTPVLRSQVLDELAGGRLYLKMESFQHSGAFKFRGAYHALLRHLADARAKGVVTGSSGNHGGALALAGRMLGVATTVVMPEDAAGVKLQAVQETGARVVFQGLTSDERLQRAQELAAEQGQLMVPPYDHEDVIAGQGTVALEALEQVPDMDLFLAPCGGGGLLAGCATYLAGVHPAVEVWGVEAARASDTWLSYKAGHRLAISLPDTIADGMRNLTPGELTFPLIRRHCRGIRLVEEEEIIGAMRILLLRQKILAEPTGAVAPAALFSRKLDLDGRTAVAVVSGGNVDSSLIARCLE